MNHQFDNIQIVNTPWSDARVADEGQERMNVSNRNMNSDENCSKGCGEQKGGRRELREIQNIRNYSNQGRILC
jgi:hypothetical protein